jgi:hypothetical protein
MNSSSIKKSKIYTTDSIPDVTTSPVAKVSIAQTLSKWIPLLCAGAAVGVSVIALKEIKNVRKDLIALNLQKTNTPPPAIDNSVLEKIKQMDTQLIKISEYLARQQKQNKYEVKKEVPPVLTKIINEDSIPDVKKEVIPPQQKSSPQPPTAAPPVEKTSSTPVIKEEEADDEEVEYVYEEVTDDDES